MSIEDQMLQEAGIQQNMLDSIHKASQFAELKAYEDKGSSSKESNAGLAMGIGYASGFLIYLTMFIYGTMVMRGVMEEKTNRIAEVIISSVKPFELMLGKIIGIGAVGLTQFILWITLIISLTSVATNFLPADIQQQVTALQQNNGQMAAGMANASESAKQIYAMQHTFATANWPLIISCFIFYFLGEILVLFFFICSSRKCGERRRTRRSKFIISSNHAIDIFLYHYQYGDTKSKYPHCILGKYDSI